MVTRTIGLAVLVGWLLTSNVQADDNTLKAGAKKVGQETGEVVHKVGEAGKEVGKKVVEVTHKVVDAAREGAKEFHKAATGKNKHNHHASSSASSSSHQ